ncbi:MAG: hypothetical protein AAF772_01050 [Acidobacteriota bacterium]
MLVSRHRRHPGFLPIVLLIALAPLLAPIAVADDAIDPALLSGLEARSIGPATMSGRIGAVAAVVPDDGRPPRTLYAGAATGGVWRSRDGGVTWTPIFDDQPVAAIGAIAVHPRQPGDVWVGTGEGNPRNSASVGNGVYRSRDGGDTWTHVGLDGSERIHRVLLHPDDPDVAYVAALGPTWADGEVRGVYGTRDGGATWTRLLHVDARTGAGDLAMDPANPDHLIAALWSHRRTPWTFTSGGVGSGLQRSLDGGRTWTAITPEDGLPKGTLGRIGVAFAPSDSRIVYAYVEAEGDVNHILRSTDGGRTWHSRATSADQVIGNRPFYYADLRVDPADPTRLYSLWSRISMSEDGGANWRVLVPFTPVHPDHHALWIHPHNPRWMVSGNDGGIYISEDHGHRWRYAANLPLAQFYHLRVDRETPYNVYGGLQDNGSWRGPSNVWENGGIRNHHWQEVFFGDGFDTIPDPENARRGYAMSQQGYLGRWNLDTGEQRMLRPAPDPDGPSLRFSWNAAFAQDPFDPATIYFGSQFVHRSRDRGDRWATISDDLTSNDPARLRQAESGGVTADVTGAENHATLIALAPSTIQRNVLWASSDDGRLHLTRDADADAPSWTRVDGGFVDAPAGGWIPQIAPSQYTADGAIVVIDNHRRGDMATYVQRTWDGGRTWYSLADDPDLRGYAHAVAHDPVNRDLLFLGTEFGLFATLDGGRDWWPLRHGLPTAAVRDLAIHPDTHDLVIATHGRGIFVIDNIRPLRDLDAATLARDLHLFPISPAQQHWIRQTGSSRFPGHGEFRGATRPYGAHFDVIVGGDRDDLPHPDAAVERDRLAQQRAARAEDADWQAREAGVAPPAASADDTADAAPDTAAASKPPMLIFEIADADGRRVRRFERPAVRGLQRIAWDLTRDAFPVPGNRPPGAFEPSGGPQVPPGTYTVHVTLGDASQSGTFIVRADPRVDLPPSTHQARYDAAVRAQAHQGRLAVALDRIQTLRGDLGRLDAARTRDESGVLARLRTAMTPPAVEDDDASAPSADNTAANDTAGADASADPDAAKDDTALANAIAALREQLDALEDDLWQRPDLKGLVADVDAMSTVNVAGWFVGSSWDAPSPNQLAYLDRAARTVDALLARLDALVADGVTALRDQLDPALQPHLPTYDPLVPLLDLTTLSETDR